MEMDLDEILISSRNETVSLEMLCDIFCDLILIQILVSSVDEQLRIVTVSELIILCIDSMNCHFLILRVDVICGLC